MSVCTNELLASNVIDTRFGLPLVSVARNPHIYCADAVRVLETLGPEEKAMADDIRVFYEHTFLRDCEINPGLITTYPGEEIASHDDLLGAAFMSNGSNSFAERVAIYLLKEDGSYTDTDKKERFNVFRFLFLSPTVRSLALFRVGILSQILYCAALLFNLWFAKPGQLSGHNKLWLTFPTMLKHPLSGLLIRYWDKTQIKRGLTPKKMFETAILRECPWFGKWAPESWIV